jgi:hypothetical protein
MLSYSKLFAELTLRIIRSGCYYSFLGIWINSVTDFDGLNCLQLAAKFRSATHIVHGNYASIIDFCQHSICAKGQGKCCLLHATHWQCGRAGAPQLLACTKLCAWTKWAQTFFCQWLSAIKGIGSCVWRSPALLNFQLVRQVLTASHLVCGCCFSHMPWSDGRRASGCTWACSCNCRIVSKPEGVSLMRDTEDNFPCSVIFSHILEFKA